MVLSDLVCCRLIETNLSYIFYLQVFNIVIYLVALSFLLFLHVHIRKNRKELNAELTNEHKNTAQYNSRRSVEIHTISDLQSMPHLEAQKLWRRTLISTNNDTGTEVSNVQPPRNIKEESVYVYGAPGVNFFLRVGAIGINFQFHCVV